MVGDGGGVVCMGVVVLTGVLVILGVLMLVMVGVSGVWGMGLRGVWLVLCCLGSWLAG